MLLVATGTGAAAAGSASPARPVVQPTQEQAALLEPQKAFSKPDLRSPPVGLVQARRPITDAQTVLPVIGHATGPVGVPWLCVGLPGRLNGQGAA